VAEGEGFGLYTRIEDTQLIENLRRVKRCSRGIRAQLERNWNTLIGMTFVAPYPQVSGRAVRFHVATAESEAWKGDRQPQNGWTPSRGTKDSTTYNFTTVAASYERPDGHLATFLCVSSLNGGDP